MRLLTLVALVLVLAPLPAASATWFIQGECHYYYRAYARDFGGPPFSNRSNVQKTLRMDGRDRVIMKNSAIMARVNRKAPYPFNAPAELLPFTKSGYGTPEDVAYIRDLSKKITGDAATVYDAAERIALWVRNNVTYGLGAPSDAIGVIKSGRAYCVGYGEVAVELLRAAGIPSRTLTCHVPPNCGWGFNNAGGGHAFAEFYYPGTGWVSVDPQSTFLYADPYHIVSEGFDGEVSRNDESYITGFKPEPSKWEIFSAPCDGKPLQRSFVFSLRDERGNRLLDFKDIVIDGTRGGTCARSTWNPSGFTICDSGKIIFARTSKGSKYVSAILKGTAGGSESVPLFLHTKSCLFAKTCAVQGPGLYKYDIDFLDAPGTRRIYLFDSSGSPLKHGRVALEIKGRVFELTADAYGRIHLVTDERTLKLTMQSRTFDVDCSSSALRVPAAPVPDDPLPSFINRKGLLRGKEPLLLCVIYDETGHPSSWGVDRAYIIENGTAPRSLPVDAPGVAWSSSLKPGAEYEVLFEYDGRYVRRRFRAVPGEEIRLDIRPMKERYAVLVHSDREFMTGLNFTELTAGGGSIPYMAPDGRTLISFPPGDYVFSDRNSRERADLITIGEKTEKAVFSPGELSLNRFVKIQSHLEKKGLWLAGAVRLDGRKAGDCTVRYYKCSTRKTGTVKADPSGNFLIDSMEAGTTIVLVAGDGRNTAVMRHLFKGDAAGPLVIDTARLVKRTITWKKDTTKVPSLIIPARGKGHIALPLFSQELDRHSFGGSDTRVIYADAGEYIVSLDGVETGSLLGPRDPACYLPGDTRTVLERRIRMLSAFAAEGGPRYLARILDLDGKPFRRGPLSLRGPGMSLSLTPDIHGIIEVDGLKKGARYSLRYGETGSIFEMEFTAGGGTAGETVAFGSLPASTLTFPCTGALEFCAPVPDDRGGLELNPLKVLPDAGGRIRYSGTRRRLVLRPAVTGCLASVTAAPQVKISCEKSQRPDDEYFRAAEAAAAGETAVLVRLLHEGKPLSRCSLSLNERTYNTGADGFVMAVISARDVRLTAASPGLTMARRFSLLPGQMNRIEIDGASCSVVVDLTGTGIRSMTLYAGATVEKNAVARYKAKYVLSPDSKGHVGLLLDPGVYYIETPDKRLNRIQVPAGRQALKIKISG